MFCNVDLRDVNDRTVLQIADHQGHTGIMTLIRNKKHKSDDRRKKDTLVQTSPAQTKKNQETGDRVMKELLEEEDKDAVSATAVSQKKKQAKKPGKESVCEYNWWIRLKRRNRIGQDLVEFLVCDHTNLRLEYRLEIYETGISRGTLR